MAERERGGPYRSLTEVAARSGMRRTTLEQLAWSGACDRLLEGQDRRTALWQLGMAAPAMTVGEASAGEAQLALPLDLPEAPRLRKLGRWQRLIADYSTSGVTIGDHAMAVLRERLNVPKLTTSAQLTRLPSGCEVALGGLVIARQRPGTAGGTMFLLFEDEFGTVNLIVPKAVYERRRHLARAEPLLLARGRLERSQEGGTVSVWGARKAQQLGRPVLPLDEEGEEIRPVVNLIVRELEPLERFLDGGADGEVAAARVHRLPASIGASPSPEEGEEEGGGGRLEHPRRGSTRPELRGRPTTLGWNQPSKVGGSHASPIPIWTSSRSASAATSSAGRSTSSAPSRCSTPIAQAGGNFIDTADMYGRRGDGGTGLLRADRRPLDRRPRQPRGAGDRDQGRHVLGAAGPLRGERQGSRRGLARAAWGSSASTSTTPTGTTPTRRSRRPSGPSGS